MKAKPFESAVFLNDKRKRKPKPVVNGADEGTRERVLRTSERLFADRGYNGVSMREIAAKARVNVASIAYHFENKEGLLSEVYRIHCGPMIKERLWGLEEALRLRGHARIAAIIEAFVRPAFRHIEDADGKSFIRLRAVLSGENSELLEKLVASNFEESSQAFIGELCKCLPQLTRTDVCWRFHFMLGAIYYTAAGPHLIYAFSNHACDPSNNEAVIRKLVPFMTAAFCAPPDSLPKATRARSNLPPGVPRI